MPLFLKTVIGVCKFSQQLALECTKLIKVGIYLLLMASPNEAAAYSLL